MERASSSSSMVEVMTDVGEAGEPAQGVSLRLCSFSPWNFSLCHAVRLPISLVLAWSWMASAGAPMTRSPSTGDDCVSRNYPWLLSIISQCDSRDNLAAANDSDEW